LEIVRHLPISVVFAGDHAEYIDWCSCQLVIDAIFGYGLNRHPENTVAAIINKINSMSCPVISLDVPSGIDSANGHVSQCAVRANATLTLALPKTGLFKNPGGQFVGDIYIGDISVPPILYCQLGLKVESLFEKNPIIHYKKVENRRRISSEVSKEISRGMA
jgi:NAD(P)H-hydrate epimerase